MPTSVWALFLERKADLRIPSRVPGQDVTCSRIDALGPGGGEV